MIWLSKMALAIELALRASPTGEASRETKAKFLNFSYSCSIYHLQQERHPERHFAFSSAEKAFLQVIDAKSKIKKNHWNYTVATTINKTLATKAKTQQ